MLLTKIALGFFMILTAIFVLTAIIAMIDQLNNKK